MCWKSIVTGRDQTNALIAHTRSTCFVWAIRALVWSLPVTIDFQHIDGHQDAKDPLPSARQDGTTKCVDDEEVKHYLRYLISLPSTPSLPQTIYKEGGVVG